MGLSQAAQFDLGLKFRGYEPVGLQLIFKSRLES
jgi:hypothetical protein